MNESFTPQIFSHCGIVHVIRDVRISVIHAQNLVLEDEDGHRVRLANVSAVEVSKALREISCMRDSAWLEDEHGNRIDSQGSTDASIAAPAKTASAELEPVGAGAGLHLPRPAQCGHPSWLEGICSTCGIAAEMVGIPYLHGCKKCRGATCGSSLRCGICNTPRTPLHAWQKVVGILEEHGHAPASGLTGRLADRIVRSVLEPYLDPQGKES